jgi:hypothetical protein
MLLSLMGHTAKGIMIGGWSLRQLQQPAHAELLFSPYEAARMCEEVKWRAAAPEQDRSLAVSHPRCRGYRSGKGDGEVGEESTEKPTVPRLGFTERGRAASPGWPEEGPGVKNGRDAQAEAVRCTMMASRERKMKFPENDAEVEHLPSYPAYYPCD